MKQAVLTGRSTVQNLSLQKGFLDLRINRKKIYLLKRINNVSLLACGECAENSVMNYSQLLLLIFNNNFGSAPFFIDWILLSVMHLYHKYFYSRNQ